MKPPPFPAIRRPGLKPTAGAALLLTPGLAGAGCIHHKTTIYRDTERASVEVESDTAARLFYEASSKTPATRRRTESGTQVRIPIIFEHKHREIEGGNTRFNQAVERRDTHRDGRITAQEARLYAEHRAKK